MSGRRKRSATEEWVQDQPEVRRETREETDSEQRRKKETFRIREAELEEIRMEGIRAARNKAERKRQRRRDRGFV